MSNNLSDIVNVKIEIEQPVENTTSFNYGLIVGPQPDVYDYSKAKEVRGCYVASSYDEVVSIVKEICGILNDDGTVNTKFDIAQLGYIEVLEAAKVAFSQSVPPAKVYIAFNKHKARYIENCKVVLCNTAEELELEVGEENIDTSISSDYPKLVVEYEHAGDSEEAASLVLKKDDSEVTKDLNGTVSVDGKKYNIYTIGDEFEGAYSVAIEREDTVFSSEFALANIGSTSSPEAGYSEDQITHYSMPFESIEATIEEASLTDGWYVVMPTYLDPDILYKLDEIISVHTKLLAYPVIGDIEDVSRNFGTEYEEGGETKVYDKYSFNDLVTNRSLRSFGLYVGTYYGQSADKLIASADRDNRYAHIAWCVKCLNYQSGSETWALKTLVGIAPCELSSTAMKVLKGEDQSSNAYGCHVSYYTTYAGRDITQVGKVNYGEWIDTIRFRDWLQNDMQIRIFNVLVKNTKVPYTDEGIALIKNQMIASLKQGQVNGGIAPTEFDEDDEEIPGFVVTVPLASQVSDIQKASRILTDCKFRARLAGAIHAVEVFGVLAYDL